MLIDSDVIEGMKRVGYDYQNMSVEELKANGIRNAELDYDAIRASKMGLTYGKYVALKSAGKLPELDARV